MVAGWHEATDAVLPGAKYDTADPACASNYNFPGYVYDNNFPGTDGVINNSDTYYDLQRHHISPSIDLISNSQQFAYVLWNGPLHTSPGTDCLPLLQRHRINLDFFGITYAPLLFLGTVHISGRGIAGNGGSANSD